MNVVCVQSEPLERNLCTSLSINRLVDMHDHTICQLHVTSSWNHELEI